MVKDQVHVDHGEQDKAPHQDMVQLPDMHITTKEWYDPRKKFGKCRGAHCRVHSESRKALNKENQESDKIDKTCQRIMANRIDLFMGNLKNINFDHIQNFLPLTTAGNFGCDQS